ncbi:hypothetical protein PIB30_088096, partial [Stylosanthes scabra]|nr:hypothetical protein [Stylosanthes scabra]
MGHSLEQCASSKIKFDSEATEECSGSQTRDNIPIDPDICISTVLSFPYDRSVSDLLPTGNKIEPDTFGKQIHSSLVDVGLRYDPRFILRFSIHCLSKSHIEPVEFAGSGLLAIAFVGMSSSELGIRKSAYCTLDKFKSALEVIPLFDNFFWSSSINFKAERCWMLRLLYAGLNSDDDGVIYIKHSILESLMSFYVSTLLDVESKDLIIEVIKKSVKFHKIARHLVKHCSLLSWFSSIISVNRERLSGEEKRRFL